MNVFAKIFAQIFDSSIASDYIVRHIFMDLLVLADRDGVVDMTPDAISRRTNVPEDMVVHAISELMKPDGRSRSPEEDGRRLVPLDSHRDWGWQIVNFDHYRAIRDEESRKTYFRDYKRKYRQSTKSTNSPHLSTVVLDCPTMSTEGEVEREVEVEVKQKPSRAKKARAAKVDPTKTDLSKARHAEFKSIIAEYWDSKNPGVQMPWDGREGKHLEMFLRAAPDITAHQFRGFLRNRFKSEVNHGERASMWIQWVTSYAAGPMDRFGKTIGASGSAVAERDAFLGGASR